MAESPRMRMIGISFALLACLPAAGSAGIVEANRALIITDEAFTADPYILAQASLMVELLYRMDESQGLLFDPEEPGTVLGRVTLRNLTARSAEDSLAAVRDSMRARLTELAATPDSLLTGELKSLRAKLPRKWTRKDIAESAGRLAGRRGMRRSFRLSLEASLPYLRMMDSVLRAEGVPSRLKYLPHVESRFNPAAVSPAGAAGIWQFLEASASRYIRIDDRIDQRFDPDAATRAAARYLRYCRENLGSWPLAVLAYNAGPGLVREAMTSTGSREAGTIVSEYRTGAFGPVSRNYYAAFLAVSSLAAQSDRLFPGLRKPASPFRGRKTLKLEHEWTPRQLRILSGYSTAVLKRCNPALKPVVFERNLPLPKGYELKLPAGMPSVQDLQFSDLRIAGPAAPPRPVRTAPAGLPLPGFAKAAWTRVREVLFPAPPVENRPVMAYMHSQGLLDADRLALAREDRILIEPHPALQAVLQELGG